MSMNANFSLAIYRMFLHRGRKVGTLFFIQLMCNKRYLWELELQSAIHHHFCAIIVDEPLPISNENNITFLTSVFLIVLYGHVQISITIKFDTDRLLVRTNQHQLILSVVPPR